MKITKRQLKRIVAEEKARLREGQRDYDLEDNVSYFITSGPAEKAVKYLEKLVAHSESGGDVDWQMAMNSVEPAHTNLEYAKKRLEMLKKGDGVGRTHQFESTTLKSQIRKIIREDVASSSAIADKAAELGTLLGGYPGVAKAVSQAFRDAARPEAADALMKAYNEQQMYLDMIYVD